MAEWPRQFDSSSRCGQKHDEDLSRRNAPNHVYGVNPVSISGLAISSVVVQFPNRSFSLYLVSSFKMW